MQSERPERKPMPCRKPKQMLEEEVEIQGVLEMKTMI